MDALRWLKRANEDGASDEAYDIQAPVNPIRPVDIGRASFREHRSVLTRPAPLKAVRGGIFAVIAFCFDDKTANTINRQFNADQFSGDDIDVTGKKSCGSLSGLRVTDIVIRAPSRTAQYSQRHAQ